MKPQLCIFILLSAFILGSPQKMYSQSVNQYQSKLRDDVITFLKEEGFMPELDSDGDIIFKKEGISYLITISPEVSSPMFLVLGTVFKKPEEFDENTVKLASAELNEYKGVKVLCDSDSVVIESEMFLMQADQFKYAFYVIMSQIASVAGDFYNECNKAKELLSTTESSKSYTSGSSSTSTEILTIDNPKYYTPSANKGLKITKIELAGNYTKVYCSYTNYYDSAGWCSINPETYIRTPDGKQYKLKYAFGIPVSPDRHKFTSMHQTLNFSLEFPTLPSYKHLQKIDMIEPDESSDVSSWAFYDIILINAVVNP